jgi:hypothetical protein
MKTKTLISVSILLFLSCQYISELKYKDEIVSEAYVNNPNGLALYKTKGDLQSKEVVLKPEEKFYFLEKANEEVKESWRKVLYGGKEFFAYGAGYAWSDFLEYRKLEAGESWFGVVERESGLKAFPFDKAKELEKIPAFSVVEIIALGKQEKYRNLHTAKVKMQSNKIGFIDREILRFKTKLIAEKNAKSETIYKDGYFLVTSKEPVFLDIESMLPVDETRRKQIMQKGKLLYVNYSKEIDGIRYYSFLFEHPREELKGDSSILISEANGKFLNDKDFTEYTIQNTNFKGDKKIIEQVRNIGGHSLNFSNFKLTKLSNDYNGGKYYLATVRDGLDNTNSSFLLKENNKVYSHTRTKENDFSIAEVKTFDLDRDGVLEILSESKARGYGGYILYGSKNGKYQMIAFFQSDTTFLKDKIYVGDSFDEFLPIKNDPDKPYPPYKSKSHPKGTKLKYYKGKLIKIK